MILVANHMLHSADSGIVELTIQPDADRIALAKEISAEYTALCQDNPEYDFGITMIGDKVTIRWTKLT